MDKKNSPDKLGKDKFAKRPYGNSVASQRARIINHFKELSPRLSTIQAREQYGILHPCGRIMELRKKGYKIDTHWINELDSNGMFHRTGLYVYQGRNKEITHEEQ